MRKLLLLILLFTTVFALGQSESDYKHVMHYSDLLKKVEQDGKIKITDTYFKMDRDIENRKPIGKDYMFYEAIIGKNGVILGHMPASIKFKNIVDFDFRNCFFEAEFNVDSSYLNLSFSNCIFNGEVNFNHNEIERFLLYNCTFKTDLRIEDNTLKRGFNIYNANVSSTYSNTLRTSIKNNVFDGKPGDTRIKGNFNLINFSNNKLKNGYPIKLWEVNVYKHFNITDNIIEVDSFANKGNRIKKYINNDKYQYQYSMIYPFDSLYSPKYFSFTDSKVNELNISNNHFSFEDNSKIQPNFYNYSIENTEIDELSIENEAIVRFNLNSSVINTQFRIDSTTINGDFSAMDLELPEYNVDFPWRELAGKLNFLTSDTTNFKALTNEELANEKLYSSFITTYKKFFSVYKNKGDLESANACYVEMKDVETRRLKYLYKSKGGSTYFLNYNLNRFLKYFAEYGTSPVRSIQISGWVILIFAVFYFFFYSEWDRINRSYLVKKYQKLLAYFRSNQKLEDFYSEKYKADFDSYEEFKNEMSSVGKEIPYFIKILGKPLFQLSMLKHKASAFLYRRVEVLGGKWIDLSTPKKWRVGFFSFLMVVGYLAYILIVKSLNSLILSINTFTTLGFGDIPVVGISRYVAILEGFLGWFLLSIFSVSLISQILQN